MDGSSDTGGRSRGSRANMAASQFQIQEVDEETYAEKVLERQDDDWIVFDDDGAGCVEDGREIFDDDLDNESISHSKKSQGESRKRGPQVEKTEISEPAGGNIRSMFANMPAKRRKECAAKLEDDDILNTIQELDSRPETHPFHPFHSYHPFLNKDCLKSLMTVTPKPKPVRASSSICPAAQSKPHVIDEMHNSDNEEPPHIDADFTECAAKFEDVDILNTIQELDSRPETTYHPFLNKDCLKSLMTVTPKPKPVRASSSICPAAQSKPHVIDEMHNSDNEEPPHIDADFTECAAKFEDVDILNTIQELDSRPETTYHPFLNKDCLKSLMTVTPKPKPVRASSSICPAAQSKPHVIDEMHNSDNEEPPHIDADFTEDGNVSNAVETNKPPEEEKKEPDDIIVIEDSDSNDDFSDLAFQQDGQKITNNEECLQKFCSHCLQYGKDQQAIISKLKKQKAELKKEQKANISKLVKQKAELKKNLQATISNFERVRADLIDEWMKDQRKYIVRIRNIYDKEGELKEKLKKMEEEKNHLMTKLKKILDENVQN